MSYLVVENHLLTWPSGNVSVWLMAQGIQPTPACIQVILVYPLYLKSSGLTQPVEGLFSCNLSIPPSHPKEVSFSQLNGSQISGRCCPSLSTCERKYSIVGP